MDRKFVVFCLAFLVGCTHLRPGSPDVEDTGEGIDLVEEIPQDDPGIDEELQPPVADTEEITNPETVETEMTEVAETEIAPPTEPEAMVSVEPEIVPPPEPAVTAAVEPQIVPPPEPEVIASTKPQTVAQVITGKFARIKQPCDVRANPDPQSERLRVLRPGLKVWTEPVDEQWKKVFRHGEESFVSIDCFKAIAAVEEKREEVSSQDTPVPVLPEVVKPDGEMASALPALETDAPQQTPGATAALVKSEPPNVTPPPVEDTAPPPPPSVEPAALIMPIAVSAPDPLQNSSGFVAGLAVATLVFGVFIFFRRRNLRGQGVSSRDETITFVG